MSAPPTPSTPPAAPPTVAPRPAATTLIVRDGGEGMEVLMVRRSPHASFMPGAYVFPGGAVDAGDGDAAHTALLDEPLPRLLQRVGTVSGLGDAAAAFVVAGLRECFEECGLWLGAPDHHAPAGGWAALRAQLHAGATLATLAAGLGLPLATACLHPLARWVTPVGLPKRFDTLFLVARAPAGQVPEVDAGETTTLAWVHPAAALAARGRGEFQMEFATVQVVQSLAPFASAQALLDHAAGLAALAVVHPRVTFGSDGRISGVLLPGQPGYELAWAG